MAFCYNCGNDIPDGAEFCPHCGANLNHTTCTCQEGGEVTNPFAALKFMVQNNEEV